jgi:hypothetical protein
LDGHSWEPDDLPPVLEETLPLIQHGGDSGGVGGSCDSGYGSSCGGCGSDSCGGVSGGVSGDVSGGDGGGTLLNSTIPLARREDYPAQPNSVLNITPQSQSTVSRGGGETRPPPSSETRPPPSGELEDPVQDTVGVVVLDRLGHVASSVSSGGIGKLGSHQSLLFKKFKFGCCANNKFENMLL